MLQNPLCCYGNANEECNLNKPYRIVLKVSTLCPYVVTGQPFIYLTLCIRQTRLSWRLRPSAFGLCFSFLEAIPYIYGHVCVVLIRGSSL